jgi:hypothetical protein
MHTNGKVLETAKENSDAVKHYVEQQAPPVVMARCQMVCTVPAANVTFVCNLPATETVTFTPQGNEHPPMVVPCCPTHKAVLTKQPPLIVAPPPRRRYGP